MKLPPLNALRAFDAAGRHKSFLLAANELHVSAASISRFIKLLENDLGHILFTRHANGVSLTELGEQYLLSVQPALQTIATVSQQFRNENSKRQLKIIAIPAIAETWLVSQLWNFQQKHKDIQINLVLDDQPVNIRPNEATVWLTPAHGSIDHFDCFAMPEDYLTLVCTPEIASTLKRPCDIFNHSLLVDVDWEKDWSIWADAANLAQIKAQQGLYFDRYSMVINAALAGSGVAIGHTALLETYLKMGTLVAPFAIKAPAEKQFYAAVASNTQRRSVKQFINWFSGSTRFSIENLNLPPLTSSTFALP